MYNDFAITSEAALGLVEWRPMLRNFLCGFAMVRVRDGLMIHDIPALTSNGKAWAWLLSKGSQPIRDKAGKPRYSPILTWSGRATSDRFSKAVIVTVEAVHRGAPGDAR